MILTGDLNQKEKKSSNGDFGDTYALYKYITGQSSFGKDDAGEKLYAPFADARIDAPDTVSPDEWASMTKYHDPADTSAAVTKQPIDYIFYTDAYLTAQVYENIHYKPNGLYMSDHLPQYAELTYTVQPDT